VEAAQNTSLASAVVAGVRMLPGRETVKPPEELEPEGFTPLEEPDTTTENTGPPPQGSILILSDGVSNVSSNPDLETENVLEIVADFAQENDVKLYGLPIGEEDTVTRIDGQDYLIPFQPDNLETLADGTDGQMLDAQDEESLRTVFRELTTSIRWQPITMEITSLISALSLVLLAVAGFLSLRWQRRVP
jgi:Ca-activated chloride channel family protein